MPYFWAYRLFYFHCYGEIETFMKQNWYKILAVLLMIYIIIAGMLIPLGPGIIGANHGNSSSALAGELVQMKVTGYNTHYTAGKNKAFLAVKLKNEDTRYTIPAENITVIDDQHLVVQFKLPSKSPFSETTEAGIFIDNKADGYSILPSALFINPVGKLTDERVWESSAELNLNARPGVRFPFRNILIETIRNTHYHVSIWMAMFVLLTAAAVYSLLAAFKEEPEYDFRASSITSIAFTFGLMGLATGSIWAKYTWGAYWTNDIKLNMTALSMMIYAAYFILRSSMPDEERKAKVSGIYNVFAFVAMIPLLFVIPRLQDSLHPGNGGNPALGGEDLDNTLRMVFYPAIIGWTLLGFWIANLYYRYKKLNYKYLFETA